jgi:hypothetical protein
MFFYIKFYASLAPFQSNEQNKIAFQTNVNNFLTLQLSKKKKTFFINFLDEKIKKILKRLIKSHMQE